MENLDRIGQKMEIFEKGFDSLREKRLNWPVKYVILLLKIKSFKTHLILVMTRMATEKNKKPIVPSPDVTKSDFTIGFSVVDLAENEVWLVDFSWNVGFLIA